MGRSKSRVRRHPRRQGRDQWKSDIRRALDRTEAVLIGRAWPTLVRREPHEPGASATGKINRPELAGDAGQYRDESIPTLPVRHLTYVLNWTVYDSVVGDTDTYLRKRVTAIGETDAGYRIYTASDGEASEGPLFVARNSSKSVTGEATVLAARAIGFERFTVDKDAD